MLERVGAREGEDPRVAAAAVDPLERALVGAGLVAGRPAREQRRVAVLGEVPCGAGDDALGELVRRKRAVAIGEPGLRRDDERRVAGDQVEHLACDGLEEAAGARLDVVDPVQRGVERGEGERAWIDVRGDNAIGVRGREERLHAVAGADVEGARDAPSRRERGARPRRRRVRRDVVGRIVDSARPCIGGDQQLVHGQEPHERLDAAPSGGEPEPDERLGDGVAQLARGHRQREEECADDRAEACLRKPPRVHGDVAVAGRVRVLAEQLVHGVLRVADPAERRAQGPCGREIDDRVHGDTVSECRDSLLGVQSTQRSTCSA